MPNLNVLVTTVKPSTSGFDNTYKIEPSVIIGKEDKSITVFDGVESTLLSTGVLTGTVAPTVTPKAIGQMFVDTTAKVGYIACGLLSTDWKQITN